MTPDWLMLPTEVITRIGRLLVQQADFGTQKLVQAVHFASVCHAFRAASQSPEFWAPDRQLELEWRLTGWGPVSSLVRSWALCFQGVSIMVYKHWAGQATASLQLRGAPGGQRMLNIDMRESLEERQQWYPELLASCLSLADPNTRLILNCDTMSAAEVQQLAGLRISGLYLACHSGFRLDALPATGNTLVRFRAQPFTYRRAMLAKYERSVSSGNPWSSPPEPPEDVPPLMTAWCAMTAGPSSFCFHGPTVVEGYFARPPPPAAVQVHNWTHMSRGPALEADDLVTGLPWEDMRAGHDGWRVSETRHPGFIKEAE